MQLIVFEAKPFMPAITYGPAFRSNAFFSDGLKPTKKIRSAIANILKFKNPCYS